MRLIGAYLEKLNSEESKASLMTFHVDSFPRKKKRKNNVLRVVYPESKSIMIKRAMIDLDGTIHKYSNGWKDGTVYDEPIPGAKEVIEELSKRGYEIVIYTTRVSPESNDSYKDQINMVKEWLEYHEIYFDRISAEKLAAEFYIDDRAIHFNGSWTDILSEINRREKVAKH